MLDYDLTFLFIFRIEVDLEARFPSFQVTRIDFSFVALRTTSPSSSSHPFR